MTKCNKQSGPVRCHRLCFCYHILKLDLLKISFMPQTFPLFSPFYLRLTQQQQPVAYPILAHCM